MANMVSFRGGAKVGLISASWPFALLTATPDGLTLKVLFFGCYSFRPEDIVVIERYSILPILGWGVRINHVKTEYPEKIIFWCLGSPDSVLQGIDDSGFRPQTAKSAQQVPRTSPVRWISVAVAIVIWNALIGFDLWRTRRPGVGALVALAFVFFMSTAVWWLPPIRGALMKPQRSPEEIRHWLRLLTLVSGLMLALFALLFFTGSIGPR